MSIRVAAVSIRMLFDRAKGGDMTESVADLMQPCESTIRSTSTLADAALAMLKAHVREATVVDDNGLLIGVVHAEDLFDVNTDVIESIIKPARLVLPADTSSVEAVRIMHKIRCDRAVVVQGEKVVGEFTWADALSTLADQLV